MLQNSPLKHNQIVCSDLERTYLNAHQEIARNNRNYLIIYTLQCKGYEQY